LNPAYLDANVFIYAVGSASQYREPCREILEAVVEGRLRGETSVYTIQEVARQRHRRGDESATERARAAAAICSEIHPLDGRILVRALEAVDRHDGLEVSDAIHAATALAVGIDTMVSADSDFDGIPGIERVDPLDRERLAGLIAGG
jgi:uncharacterized protein